MMAQDLFKGKRVKSAGWFKHFGQKRIWVTVFVVAVAFISGLTYIKIRLTTDDSSEDSDQVREAFKKIKQDPRVELEGITVHDETEGEYKNDGSANGKVVTMEGSVRLHLNVSQNLDRITDTFVKAAQQSIGE